MTAPVANYPLPKTGWKADKGGKFSSSVRKPMLNSGCGVSSSNYTPNYSAVQAHVKSMAWPKPAKTEPRERAKKDRPLGKID
jgi:hypothetical protein